MIYKGIDSINNKKVIRSIGINEAGGQLGFGFLNKFNKKIDEMNSTFYYYSLVYVIRGNGTYIDSEGNEYELSPGSLFQRFPGVTHTNIIDPSSKWSECYIDFGSEIFNFLVSMRVINLSIPVYKISPDTSIEETFYFNMLKLEECLESELSELLAQSIILIQRIFNLSSSNSEIPKHLIDKSCVHFTTDLKKRINIKDYCKNSGLGYESFRKVFKNYIGVSPRKYIVHRRIDMACQILRSTTKNIGEISDDLGYKSQYEFSAQFKKVTGISPQKFRTKK